MWGLNNRLDLASMTLVSTGQTIPGHSLFSFNDLRYTFSEESPAIPEDSAPEGLITASTVEEALQQRLDLYKVGEIIILIWFLNTSYYQHVWAQNQENMEYLVK